MSTNAKAKAKPKEQDKPNRWNRHGYAKLPSKASEPHDEFPYVLWAHCPVVIEDDKPIKRVAMFRYWLEALDYKTACNERGADLWMQSPGGVTLYRADGTSEIVNSRKTSMI